MRSIWRFFPYFVVAAMAVVVAVNGVLVVSALRTSPGKSGEGFALSNHYDAVLAQAEREAALGWTVIARVDADGRPAVALADRAGASLQGAAVVATARRPLGDPDARVLVFREAGSGRYVADAALPLAGQWDLTLSASAGGQELAATRRVIVH